MPENDEFETLNLTQLHQRVGDVVSRVYYAKTPIVLTKHERQFVALIPLTGDPDQDEQLLNLITRALEHGLPPESPTPEE